MTILYTFTTLSPPLALGVFVAAVVAGARYRSVWKADGPRWQLWLWGVIAASGLLIVGLIPVAPPL